MQMVVVVDDFAAAAKALDYLPRSQGIVSIAAHSGPKALEILRNQPPQEPLLVILDEMMPEMSGIDVLRIIRADPQISRAVVVMYSASDNPARRAEALASGAAAWFEKAGPRGHDVSDTIQSMLAFYPVA